MESKDTMYVTVHGENRVQLVQKLRAAADNLDGTPAETTGKPAKSTAKKQQAAKPAPADDDAEEFKADDSGEPSGFDEEENAEAEAEQDAEDFTEEKPPKKGVKGKPKKITIDDVNDACKAHAAAKGRPATLDLLKKKFKTQSVTALKPEQFEACIAAMAVN